MWYRAADGHASPRAEGSAGETGEAADLSRTIPPKASSGRGAGGRAVVEERVLACAQRLFAERGFRDVTVRDIAAAAGVSHALVHRYLGSKKAIFGAVLQRNQGPMLARAMSAQTAREAAVAMFRELRASRPEYLKLLARAVMDGAPFDTVGHQFRAYQRLIELLERDAARGAAVERELPEPRVIAAALTALVIGWTVTESLLVPASGLGGHEPAAVEASLELVVQAMVDGSLPPAGV